MSKYKKQFIVVTEKYFQEVNEGTVKKPSSFFKAPIEVLDIRDTYNPDLDDNLNRTYAHIRSPKGEGVVVFDWNDKFEIRSMSYYGK